MLIIFTNFKKNFGIICVVYSYTVYSFLSEG